MTHGIIITFGNWTFCGHANSRTRQFADVPIRGQNVSLTCQFADCGRFTERCFADKLDYSQANCLKSPPYLLPLRDELEHVVR